MARSAPRCTYCRARILPPPKVRVHEVSVRRLFALYHRGCYEFLKFTPLRRAARERVPFPQWALCAILALLIAGAFVSTQVIAHRLVAVFGTRQVATLGVPTTGLIRNPFAVAGAFTKIEWLCHGPHVVAPRAAVPSEGGVAKPPQPASVVWGQRCPPAVDHALQAVVARPAALPFGLALFLVFVVTFVGFRLRGEKIPNLGRALPVPRLDAPRFRLFLGRATGRLAELGHRNSIKRTTPVVLVEDDCAKNIVAFGGTGSGKTAYLMLPLLRQLLQQLCGLLIFDVKGDFGSDVRRLAAQVGRRVTKIGIGGRHCNLLAGLTPEVAGTFLKSVIILAGNTAATSAFWTNTAIDLANNVLGLLHAFPDRYSLHDMHDIIYDVDGSFMKFRKDVETKLAELTTALGTAHPEVLQLELCTNYVYSTFLKYDGKVQDGARSQLHQVLGIFTKPEIDAAFCRAGPDVLSMNEVLDGEILLMDLPIDVYGIGAVTVYTFVKLRFFNAVNRRRSDPSWDQKKRTAPHVAFMCDEYQALVSLAKEGLSDLNYWDKSRSAKCIGIISAQSFRSFQAAVGDENLTKTLLQNFRQKLCFLTEDDMTIKFMTDVLGAVEVQYDNWSTGQNKGGEVSTRSSGQSIGMRTEAVANPQLIRGLHEGQALCVLNVARAAADDVLTLEPLFLEEERPIAPSSVRARSTSVPATSR